MPISAEEAVWILETQNTAYVLGYHPTGRLIHRYWGPKLPYHKDYPGDLHGDTQTFGPYVMDEFPFNGRDALLLEEYPTYEGIKFTEPCLKLMFSDGVRDTQLRFETSEVIAGDVPELQIHLRDTHYPFHVTVHYQLWESYDLIERFVTLTNAGPLPIALERVWSGQWHLPIGERYTLNHLNGRWGNEFQLRREPLSEGVKVLESRRITTSHHHNPWFAVDRGTAVEEYGEVWFGVLAWSGNWKIAAEVTDFSSTRISIGLNDWDFCWQLQPGESFTSPATYAGYTDGGHGAASRLLHDFIRDTVLPHGKTCHKVLFNSWETTFFQVDEESQAGFAKAAADMGVELFVMDDGWFHKRDSDYAALGDWWPDSTKFPNGLEPLIRRINDLGMDFGLWIEPEMVNVDSDLYRLHPDWVLHFPTRAHTEGRHQLILNMGKPEVQDYLINLLDRLLSEHNIRFIKWDMNRNVSEPGWSDAPADQREIWVRYVQGVYYVWSTLQKRHPQILWQSCSGGGGRADLGILRLADQIWTSDNTNPTSRLAIQDGFSHVFPAITMESWVTDMGDEFIPLEFRFHVSMCGVLGIGADLRKWTEEDYSTAARCIALYKEIRPIIQFGDMYRLRSPLDHTFSGIQYMDKDKATGVLFAFLTHRLDVVPPLILYPRGLDPNGVYRIEGFAEHRSGKAWMNIGLQFNLPNLGSSVCRIYREDPSGH